ATDHIPIVWANVRARLLRARRETTRAFGRRCIAASGVARRSNTLVCSTPRALLTSRIGALGAPGYFATGPKRQPGLALRRLDETARVTSQRRLLESGRPPDQIWDL